MIEHIRDFLGEPHIVKSPIIGAVGFLTSEVVRDWAQTAVLILTVIILLNQALTAATRRFICRPRDGKGPCSACNFFGRWLCPGPRKATEKERIENKYD